MRLAMKQFSTVARQTALEASRQPAFLLLSAATLLFIGLLPLLITHVLGEATRVIRDSSLALFWMAGLLLGCYGAASTISRELRLGTLASVVTKPMSRSLFFLAKFSGMALVMAAFVTVAAMASILAVHSVRIIYHIDWWSLGPLYIGIIGAFAVSGLRNFLFKSPFTSGAFRDVLLGTMFAFSFVFWRSLGSEEVGLANALPWSVVPAAILIGLAVIMLSSFAVALSTRLDLTGTMLACSVIFFAGLMADYLLGPHAQTNEGVQILYLLLPNWQNFWAVDALNRGEIPWSYIGQVTIYTFLYMTGVLLLGIAGFRNMEVKR
jgi:hypothetical protein